MTIQPYIAIEGVIGVGKTTLARYLSESLAAKLLLEVFEENPFLSNFYTDRERYAFQTQIFFLLSRYRQQRQAIPQTIKYAPLVSDYLFAKDKLFANLNLANDELTVYESVYAALAERIPAPQLVIYLRAGVDTLIERIAVRDRSYERNMDRDYIAALHRAYDAYFNDYTQSPRLVINTDEINIVQNSQARQAVIGQIKSALNEGATQPHLPHFTDEPPSLTTIFSDEGARRLPDFQGFHRTLDQRKNFSTNLYLNYILLTEEMGELATEIAHIWRSQQKLQANSPSAQAALQLALNQHRDKLKGELADCFAYLVKLANYSGIDLETAYLEKMNFNVNRNWPAKEGDK